jgi:signal transduction histidine kinase
VKLKTELNAVIGIAAGLTLLGLAVPGGMRLERFYRIEAVESKGRAMAHVLAPPCAHELGRSDATLADRLDALMGGLRERNRDATGELGLVSLAVVDSQDDVVMATGSATNNLSQSRLVDAAKDPAAEDVLVDYPENRWGPGGAALVTFAAPLRSRGGTFRGVLWFELSLERARTRWLTTLATLLSATALGALAVWFLLYKIVKFRILAPILELSRGIERVQAGDLTARVALAREDEIGTLIASFNAMVAMLLEKQGLEQRLDEAERLEISHRRLAAAHKELAEAHSALQTTQERLVLTEKQASLGRLVRSVAHELKNPLNSAQNSLPSLEASIERLVAACEKTLAAARSKEIDEDLSDVASSLAVLRRSVSRAVAIIQDLQGFAQLGEADLVPVDLRRIVDDAALSCQTAFGPDGRIALSVDLAGEKGEPITLKAFPTLLAQCFVNLFTNAAQAIHGKGTIAVTARVKAEHVRVEVKDSGPGIPPENMAKLFEPFFTTKGVSGTGLGLALAYAYVEKHGGTIEVKSEVGKGAAFTLDLPLTARPGELGPRGSSLFMVPPDSGAGAAARARRGG